jgi:CP family cyanate transporter-like MFS transporter
MSVSNPGEPPGARLVSLLALLWMIGAATRLPILAVPPLLRAIHDDLHLSEAEVGFLVSLPLLTFALASIPGSLLVARVGALAVIAGGIAVAAAGSALRATTADVVWLYATTALTGVGVAVVQPALPQLVSRWMPRRIALGTAVYTNGVMIGTTTTATLTIPLVLPAVGGSWRWALLAWTVPVAAAALVLALGAPRPPPWPGGDGLPQRRWPDWRSPVVWLLGVAFACNNSIYFGINAFLPDFLAAQGRSDLISAALGVVSGAQLVASFILLLIGERLHRRAWPFLVFGSITAATLVALMAASGTAVVVLAAVIGFATAVSFVILLALPAVLSPSRDVHRTAAGMFTISYAIGVIVPTLGGAIWDLTGVPWTAFTPLAVCAVVLTLAGLHLARLPAAD